MGNRKADPETQLASFIAKFTPEVAELCTAALQKMRQRLPGAVELVYDNYNALAIGFGPTERASDAVFSIAVYPRWISLFFLQGAGLDDPDGLLSGQGKVARHIKLHQVDMLDEPGVRALMARALDAAKTPIDARGVRKLLIKSVAEKQRPRRVS